MLLDVLKVFLRIKQAVGMVDPHSRYVASAHEIEHQRVHRGKYFSLLHPDRSQIVDIEKPAVVDFVSGNTPETQTISLIGEDALECVKAGRVALASIYRPATSVDPYGQRPAFDELCQSL